MPFKRIGATDPITGHDIGDLTGKPHVVGRSQTEDLVIYFESGESAHHCLNIPVEHSVDHHLNLDNRRIS
ncbi:MAG: hypothetical protein HKM88_03770 [Halobacteria archaeon]|nr:hypothetical protein [Halobacteria archaeon]